MICSKCKFENEEGAVYCGKCGRLLSAGTETVGKPEPKFITFLKNRKFIAVGGIAVLMLIIAGTIIATNLSGVKGSGPNGTTLDNRGFDALFAEAEADMNSGRYLEAATKYEYILPEHAKYEAAQERIDESYELYSTAVITQAEQLATDGKYTDALVKVQEGLIALPSNDRLKSTVDTVNELYHRSFIDIADSLAVSGNYDAALVSIGEGLAVFAEDTRLLEKRDVLTGDYKNHLLITVDELLMNGQYDEAADSLANAPEMFTGDRELGVKGVIVSTSQMLAKAESAMESSLAMGVVNFGGYKWRVLETQSDKVLILTENLIDLRRYDPEMTENGQITWEDCELRGWLNSEFYNSFTEQERAQIVETAVVNSDNPLYGTDGGNDTLDKVFLLSLEEVLKYFGDSGTYGDNFDEGYYNFSDEYDEARIAKLSVSQAKFAEYAERFSIDPLNNTQGWAIDYIMGWYDDENNNAQNWWLRTPGQPTFSDVTLVGKDGSIGVSIGAPNNFLMGVRPATWIKTSDDLKISYGEIQSDVQLPYIKDAIVALREGENQYASDEIKKLLSETEEKFIACVNDGIAIAIDANNYENAYSILDMGISTMPDEMEFTQVRTELDRNYADYVSSTADSAIVAGDYDTALSSLAQATEYLPNDADLLNRFNETSLAAEEAVRDSENAVVFYENANGEGWEVARPADYEAFVVDDMGFPNDRLSSVRINAEGVSVTLYNNHQFGGENITLTGKGLHNLDDYKLNDKVSSYKIESATNAQDNPNAIRIAGEAILTAKAVDFSAGTSIQVERLGSEYPNIGYWKSEGKAVWPVIVENPGRYKVLVTYSREKGVDSFDTATITAGDSTVSKDLPGTGGWEIYVEDFEIGEIELTDDDLSFVMSAAADMNANYLCNLRWIKLIPVS